MATEYRSLAETIEPSLPEVHSSVRISRSHVGWRRLLGFLGPGFLISVGYMDPGNWATDIAGGSRFGYTLLSVIMISNLMAISAAKPEPQAGRGYGARSGAALQRELQPLGQLSGSGSARRSRSPPAIWLK
jgi:hypothetical protein